MRPLLSSPLHRKLQLASQQRQDHNSAVFITQNESLLAVAILTAHISRLATGTVVAAQCGLSELVCYKEVFMLHSTYKQAAVVDSCPDANSVLMSVCCSRIRSKSALQAACFLTAAGRLMLYQTPCIVCVLLPLWQQHESTALVLTPPTFGRNKFRGTVLS